MFLYAVTDALQQARIPFALAGGYAVALHGAVRGTIDVDIVLRLRKRDFLAVEAVLKTIGLSPKLPVTAAEIFDFREEYIKNRNLIEWSFVGTTNPSQILDIIITHDLSKLCVKKIKVGNRNIPVLSIEDLIEMKRVSARKQDLEDIRALKFLL